MRFRRVSGTVLGMVSSTVLDTLDANEILKRANDPFYFVKRARYFFKNPIYPSSCDDRAPCSPGMTNEPLAGAH